MEVTISRNFSKQVDVAVIGAGSAGLSAIREIKQSTDNFLLIDHSPLGTKCARVGCMPSKALIVAANDFHRRKVFRQEGIYGSENLHISIPDVLAHVRNLRDRFTNAMIQSTKAIAGDNLVVAPAKITGPNRIAVGDKEIYAEKIIIATGSRARIPDPWRDFGDKLLTSDNIFEQKDLPEKIAVIGLGPIGMELGQAMSRLGIEIVGFNTGPVVAGTSDPQISKKTLEIFKEEFPVYVNTRVKISQKSEKLFVKDGNFELPFDAILAATGVFPEVRDLGLENLGVELNEMGLPAFDRQTSKVKDLPVYIAGDVNGWRPILHEALDEGYIAGRNSVSEDAKVYCRRTPLYLVFTDPQIAMVGLNYNELKNQNYSFVTGSTDFADQARAALELHNKGLMQIYVEKESARLLGAELFCPDAEHLSHFIASAIQKKATIFEVLQMPFYHPTVEEGLRTALRDAANKVSKKSEPQGLTLCYSLPEKPLS